MNKITSTPLTNGNSARYEKVTGVTYFKLKSEFPGDYTKNCGLLAEEMDGNFYFLRGYDIDTITLDDERNLVITRVDKDYAPMKVSLNEEFKKTTFAFDKDAGAIIITYPDGTTESVDGFLVAGKDVKMATDATIDGDGTLYNPLRLAGVEKTGTYAPAEKFVDISDSTMGKLPEGEYKGQRIVSKEKVDSFGMLYTMEAMEKIQSALTETGSEWRIPTKEDWDDLLDSIECKEYRNHSAITSTWLGQVAGAGLKSAKMWDKYENEGPCDIPSEGRDIVGLSVLPVGITPDRNAILQAEDADVEGFKKMAGMWSQTKNPEGNVFVKIFGYNHPEVYQDTYGEGARLSLRFVKDYTYDNNNEIEEILGIPVPTQLVYSIHDDYPYAKVWTKINFYSNEFDGVTYKGWSAATDEDKGVKIVYYINEYYDGRWHKKLMNEGDSVVILDYTVSGSDYSDQDYNDDYSTSATTIRYHEWRVINGELVDTLASVMGEFEASLSEINQKIESLSSTTKDFSGATIAALSELNTKIEGEKDRAEAVESELNAKIESEKDRAEAVESNLNEAIYAERDRAKAAEEELTARIQEEKERAVKVETSLNDAIYAERDRAKAAEDALASQIEEEKLRAISAETFLNDAISEEKIRAVSAETQLNDIIQKEISRAVSADTVLNDLIHKKWEEAASIHTQLNDTIQGEIDRAEEAEKILQTNIDNEENQRIANDYVPGLYILSGENSSEMVIPTSGETVNDIRIKVSDDFFNFGTF